MFKIVYKCIKNIRISSFYNRIALKLRLKYKGRRKTNPSQMHANDLSSTTWNGERVVQDISAG